MEFATDHFFHIGHSHYQSGKPCQDYAISRCQDDRAVAVVADGCSTGGQTDVGSRLIALGTMKALWELDIQPEHTLLGMLDLLKWKQRSCVEEVQNKLALHHRDLLSTCVFACLTSKIGFVQVMGDGVVAWKRRNGIIEMVRYEWAKNAPFYPAYNWQGIEAFIALQGENLESPVVSVTHAVVHPNGKTCFAEFNDSLSNGIEGNLFWGWDRTSLDDIECLAVFTDGVTQVDNVTWDDAVVRLLSFKSTAGEFAKRRMMSEIRSVQKHGEGPLDDISYSVIHILHDDVSPEAVEPGLEPEPEETSK
jgi:hypothetical protein